MRSLIKDRQYYKFCAYGFLKNLRFFDAFFILFLIEKGLPFTQIGILYAVREIVINFLEIPSGIIADTYGRKNALVASFLFSILSFYLFFASHQFWFFMLAFVLYGIADAFRSGTHKGMIMDYLKTKGREHQKIEYYGHTRSWSQKGSALSSLVAGFIVFYSGRYESIFLYSIIPYLLNLLLILSYPKVLNHASKRKTVKRRWELMNTVKSFFRIIKEPNVLKIVNASAFHTAYLRAVKDYIQPLMVNVSLLLPFMLDVEIEKKNGLLIGFIYFVIYLLTSQASKMSSKVAAGGSKNISYFSLLLGLMFGILCGIFFIYDLWILSMLAFTGIYIVENVRKPILTGYISDHVPNEILTSVMSLQSQIKTVITAIIAFSFGWMADVYGIGMAFITISILLTLITLLIHVRNRHKSKS